MVYDSGFFGGEDARPYSFKYGRRYTRTAPRQINAALAVAGGWNLYGQANFRVIWGSEHHAWIGGKFEGEKDRHGNTLPCWRGLKRDIKYPHMAEDWLLEVWRPAEFYGSPEQWPESELGPYPSRGDYELVRRLPPQEFSPYVAMALVRMVEASRGLSKADRYKEIYEREVARPEKQWDSDADAILDDAVPAFGGFSHAVVPTAYKKENNVS